MREHLIYKWAAAGLVYVICTSTIAMCFSVYLFLTRPSTDLLNERMTVLSEQVELGRRDREARQAEIDTVVARLDSIEAVSDSPGLHATETGTP